MTSLVLSDPPRQTLRRGAVAAWPLAGVAAVDLSSIMHTGAAFTLTNNAVVTRAAGPGNLRNACQFVAASSQHLSRADEARLRPRSSQFYASLWVYLDTKPAGAFYPMSKMGIAGDFGWSFSWSGSAGDRFGFISTADGTNFVGPTANVFGAPALATWYFLEGFWDGARISMSVNLNVEATAALAAMFPTTGLLSIGSFGALATTFWDGRIAQPLILDRVPTLAERQWLYNNGTGRDLMRGV